MLHRTRELLVRQRTVLINSIRSHMAEFGIVALIGVPQVKKLLRIIVDTDDARLPSLARICLESLARQFLPLHNEINVAEKRIHAWHLSNEVSRRLETTPGIGPITASALAASITDPEVFKSGCELVAWIGLVPRQTSTGGKQRFSTPTSISPTPPTPPARRSKAPPKRMVKNDDKLSAFEMVGPGISTA